MLLENRQKEVNPEGSDNAKQIITQTGLFDCDNSADKETLLGDPLFCCASFDKGYSEFQTDKHPPKRTV